MPPVASMRRATDADVDRGADEKGARRHGRGGADPAARTTSNRVLAQKAAHVRRARGPGRAELARERDRGEGHGSAATRSRRTGGCTLRDRRESPPRPERVDLGFCPRVAAPFAARADRHSPFDYRAELWITGRWAGAHEFRRVSKSLNDPQGPLHLLRRRRRDHERIALAGCVTVKERAVMGMKIKTTTVRVGLVRMKIVSAVCGIVLGRRGCLRGLELGGRSECRLLG